MRDPRWEVGVSWGRYPRAHHAAVVPLGGQSAPPALDAIEETMLPYAYGRSYGDSCLNEGGVLLDVAGLDRLTDFDQSTGLLRCEAGVSLAEILDLTVPLGWFLPVVPGTRWVSVGGAIANDIHGKNHHRAGTFGAHITRLELLRSDGDRIVCSLSEHPDLFRATVGGLGLTGVILWAEIRLMRVPGAGIALERIRYDRLAQFHELSATDAEHEYTVAWVDCLGGRGAGRGVYLRGDHAPWNGAPRSPLQPVVLRVPFDLPAGLLNRITLTAFNTLYYRRQASVRATVPYQPFFFPLDGLGAWNRLYGSPGFVQYQCVVPNAAADVVEELLQRIRRSGEVAALAVLKRFGARASPGMLSFPRPGLTLAVDFPLRGPSTLALLETLDAMVREAGGAVYPAKDARMSPRSFRAFFPEWERFAAYVDPKFSSSFWRRVAG